MTLLRTAPALVGLLLPLTLVAAPAHASDTRCAGGSAVTRCAWTDRLVGEATGFGSIASSRDRMRVRVRVVRLQRRTDGGWATVAVRRSRLWIRGGGQTQTASVDCPDARPGRYRSRATSQWKLGAGGRVHTDTVTSAPVRRQRLCG